MRVSDFGPLSRLRERVGVRAGHTSIALKEYPHPALRATFSRKREKGVGEIDHDLTIRAIRDGGERSEGRRRNWKLLRLVDKITGSVPASRTARFEPGR